MNDFDTLLERKAQIIGYIEEICSEVELTQTQIDRITTSYQAVGEHLLASENLCDFCPRVFVQGSVRLGTTVRPYVKGQHFDADIICMLENGPGMNDQSGIHRLTGDAVRESDVYKELLSILKRGWRINYAESSNFHLDITPAVPKIACPNGSVFVPDKELKRWQPSNPEGYAAWFSTRAAIVPRFTLRLINERQIKASAKPDPLPAMVGLKNVLQRIVQFLKRHRDVLFEKSPDRAPISIILTTLAAKAYAQVAVSREFDNEFDLVKGVVEYMPSFITAVPMQNGSVYYLVPNETVEGENFAEKWNKNPDLAAAFYEWHRNATVLINLLIEADGRDVIQREFRGRLGQLETDAVFRRVDERIARHRSSGILKYAAPTGLGILTGQTVTANTFYGA
jgi:hypothetical protein